MAAFAAEPQGRITVKGTVVDADNLPVAGAYVVEKGNDRNGTVTDLDGNFSIIVAEKSTLSVSCIGFVTVQVDAAPTLRVTLSPDREFLDEAVVVGYGTQRVATLTGSVAQINSEKINVAPVVNTTHVLAGQLPGLVSKQVSGLPGQDNAALNIRGFGSPLVIIDGVEGSIENLDAGQIESISILKDGSGSIYGARAGNGVILVTTKTGANMKTTVSVNSSLTMQSNIVTTLPASSRQRAQLQNDIYLNQGKNPARAPYTEEDLEAYSLGTDPAYLNSDWYHEVVRKYAPQQNHNVSVSGGTDRIKYYGYCGYNRQELQFKPNSGYYDRFNFQTNFNAKATDNLTVGMNMQYMKDCRNYPSGGDLFQDGTNFWDGIIYSADPRYPLYLPDETLLSYANMQNGSPIWAVNIDNSGYYRTNNNIFKVTGFGEYGFKHVPGLKAKANILYTYGAYDLKWMHKRGQFYTYNQKLDKYAFAGGSVAPSSLRMDSSTSGTIVQQYSLNYARDFGPHYVSALAMYETTLIQNRNFWTSREKFESTVIEEMMSGDKETTVNDSGSSNYGRRSWIGRLNYSYAEKYLFEATLRADASSRFAEGHRWGLFPSVSLGWNIAKEGFMQDTPFNMLKLRAGMGTSGYDAVADFNYLTGYRYDLFYTFGDQTYNGLISKGLANENLTWETMRIYNLGLDFSLWSRKLYGEVDAFRRDRTGIPGYRSQSLPTTFGATLPQENLNATRTIGFEIMLGTSNKIGDFSYDISANVSCNRTRWTYFDQAEETDPDRIRLYQNTGQYVDRQIGYLTDGLFASDEEVAAWPVSFDDLGNDNSTIKAGDIKFVDTNDDGVINWRDQQVIGKGSLPHWMGGLSINLAWRGFDFQALVQGAWGYTIGMSYAGNTSTYCDRYFDARHNADPHALVSRPSGATVNGYSSDFYSRDCAYARLKNLAIGYTIPERLTKKVGVSKFRIYAGGMNLFTLSNISKYGVDPESTGTIGHSYPQQYTMSLGCNIVL
ncbi:MAG: TonB-dependent receptor [Bacteroidales bacterium]|nr:TonB-dependent receptor [Bacteroidales bacterium]